MSKGRKTLKGKVRADIGLFLVDQLPDYYDTAFDHMDITAEDGEQFNADFDATLDYMTKHLKEMTK